MKKLTMAALSAAVLPMIIGPMKALASAPKDKVSDFVVTGPIYTNIHQVDKFKEGKTSEVPWSSSYWRTVLGDIAFRYKDPEFPFSKVWQENYNAYLAKPTDQTDFDHLSPAEKYDLVMGDKNLTLTAQSWKKGARDAKRPVDAWEGLNHGLASASLKMAEPLNSVTVRLPSPDERTVTFTSTDIKALLIKLWAEDAPAARFLGNRCKDPEPTERCVNDLNPSSWHLAMVNQIGVKGLGLVADLDMLDQVWNYPISRYKMNYFNPKTLQSSDSLADVTVDLASFPEDEFKASRAPQATRVVGVVMTFEYTVPTSANAKSKAPATAVAKMIYDLELDSEGEIVGGEWRNKSRPDFLWVQGPELAGAKQAPEFSVSQWQSTAEVPQAWRKKAIELSSRSEPLAVFVYKLLEESRRPN